MPSGWWRKAYEQRTRSLSFGFLTCFSQQLIFEVLQQPAKPIFSHICTDVFHIRKKYVKQNNIACKV